ncbi:hypothetical protein [Micromonospora sp. NPDC023814]
MAATDVKAIAFHLFQAVILCGDRGTGVAATELGVLAGADRVEGFLVTL